MVTKFGEFVVTSYFFLHTDFARVRNRDEDEHPFLKHGHVCAMQVMFYLSAIHKEKLPTNAKPNLISAL